MRNFLSGEKFNNTLIKENKKSAYKPVIDHIEPISEPKKIEKPTKKEEQLKRLKALSQKPSQRV